MLQNAWFIWYALFGTSDGCFGATVDGRTAGQQHWPLGRDAVVHPMWRPCGAMSKIGMVCAGCDDGGGGEPLRALPLRPQGGELTLLATRL